MEYHNPVLLHESVDGLNIHPDGIYVDVTFGGGGHSREILNRLGPNGKLYAFDQDEDALANALQDDRFVLINENFRFIKRFLRFHNVKAVDGILGDLGVSSHQFDVAERGFSTRFDAELDMRMSQKNDLSAYRVVNEYDEDNLRRVFLDYGELKNAPAIARVILEAREKAPIRNTEQLKQVLSRFLPAHKSHKRLSIISYHSLEDRLVKRFVKNGMFEGEPERDFFGNFSVPFKTVGKLIVPNNEQIKENNRARSAKLRIAEKI